MTAQPNRDSFLQSLFEFDPEELVEWHRFRSSPEKRRFLRFIDAFYRWNKKRLKQPLAPVPEDFEVSPSSLTEAQVEPQSIIAEETSEAASERGSTRASTCGDSSLGAWVARRSRRAKSAADSASIGWTSVSEMAPTENSVCSAPLPVSRLQFRSHRRGIAINRRLWRAPDAHVPSSTIPTDQFPDERRLVTMQMRAFGRPPPRGAGAAAGDERLLRGVFRVDKFPLVLEFLASESAAAKESHVAVLRGLHALRRTSHYATTAGNAYDLSEDFRLWRPKRATPALTPYQIFASKIPVGTLAATISEILRENGESQPTPAANSAPVVVEDDALSELTASDATHVTLEYSFLFCVLYISIIACSLIGHGDCEVGLFNCISIQLANKIYRTHVT
jgi:hypothetical protein